MRLIAFLNVTFARPFSSVRMQEERRVKLTTLLRKKLIRSTCSPCFIVLHAFFGAVQYCLNHSRQSLDSEIDDDNEMLTSSPILTRVIPKITAERAVCLTEYFQDQRKVYEDVSKSVYTILPKLMYYKHKRLTFTSNIIMGKPSCRYIYMHT